MLDTVEERARFLADTLFGLSDRQDRWCEKTFYRMVLETLRAERVSVEAGRLLRPRISE